MAEFQSLEIKVPGEFLQLMSRLKIQIAVKKLSNGVLKNGKNWEICLSKPRSAFIDG